MMLKANSKFSQFILVLLLSPLSTFGVLFAIIGMILVAIGGYLLDVDVPAWGYLTGLALMPLDGWIEMKWV